MPGTIKSTTYTYTNESHKCLLLYRGSAWEEAFLSSVGNAVDNAFFKHIYVARFASRTLDHELERNTRSVIPYFTSTFVLMGAFR